MPGRALIRIRDFPRRCGPNCRERPPKARILMRVAYSYVRLTLASWMFLGGIALQFVPSAAAVEREARHRARLIQDVPLAERAEWIRMRDIVDARSEAYLRVFGVLFGGLGLAVALFESACVSARISRHCPLDTA